MRAGTGVVGMLLMLSVLGVSSANTKPAEARATQRTLVQAPAPRAESSPVVVTPVAAEPASVETSPAAPAAKAKLRRLRTRDLSPALMLAAAEVVRRHYAKPIGTEIALQVEGRNLVARVERHYHPEGGDVKPWGYHPGVSLFAVQ